MNFVLEIISYFKFFFKTVRDSYASLSFSSPHFRLSLKISLAAMLALSAAFYFELPRPNWAAWTASQVLLPSVAASMKKASLRFIGTWIAFVIGILIYGFFFANPFVLILAYAVYVAFLTYKKNRSNYDYFWWMLASVSVLILIAVLGGGPEDGVTLASYRAIEISIGVISAMLINFLIWPSYIQDKFHETVKILRNDLFLYFEEITEKYLRYHFENNEKTFSLYSKLKKQFSSLDETLHLVKIERKIVSKKNANRDINIDELELFVIDLNRFEQLINNYLPTFQTICADDIKEIINGYKTITENIYQNEEEHNKLLDILWEKIIHLSDAYNNYDRVIEKTISANESAIFYDYANLLKEYYFYLRKTINDNITFTDSVKLTPLISLYSDYFKIKWFKKFFYIHLSTLLSSIKTGICFAILLSVLIFFKLNLEASGTIMLYAAILYVGTKTTKSLKLGFFVILGTLFSFLFSVFFVAVFPEQKFILFIFIFFVVFFFASIRTFNSDNALRHFCIWGLAAFLACELTSFHFYLAIFSSLDVLLGAVIGLTVVYAINNYIFPYCSKKDLARKCNGLNNIFADIKVNFYKLINNEKTFFVNRLDIYPMLTLLEETGTLIKNMSLNNKTSEKIKTMNWIFYELRVIFSFRYKLFLNAYTLSPNLFIAIIDEVSKLNIFSDKQNIEVDEIIKELDSLKDQFYSSSKIDVPDLKPIFLAVRRVIELLSLLQKAHI